MSQYKQTLKKLFWIEDLLPLGVLPKKMHGGIGYYLEDRLVLILVEAGASYEYKGVSYPFVIWDGVFFPIEPIKQGRVFMDYPFLENHPASPKWLYLPTDTEGFEGNVENLLRQIKKRDPLFGIQIKSEKILFDESENFSKPKIFSEAPSMKRPALTKKNTKKNVEKKIKADKKTENNFLLNVLKRRS